MLDLTKVMITVPTRGLVDYNVVTRLDKLRETYPELKKVHYIPGRLSVSHVRNHIVKLFLETDNEYLVMIDDDVVPNSKMPSMLQHDVDIVGAPYFLVRDDVNIPFPCAFLKNELRGYKPLPKPFEYLGQPALVRCDGIATGCIAIKRKVLEHPDMKVPFDMIYDINGMIKMTDDLAFCSRADKAGFEIYCDFGVPADHMIQGVSMNLLHAQYIRAFESVKKAEENKSRIILP